MRFFGSSGTSVENGPCHRGLVFVVVIMLGAALGAGCSAKNIPNVKTAPVSGTVTYKGQPVAGAQVGFVNNDRESGRPATATTDSSGRYQLQTFLGGTTQAKGAMPGEYKVTVIKVDNSGIKMPEFNSGSAMTDASADDPSKAAGEVKVTLPEKYLKPDTSGLTATVKESGENTFNFDLTD